MGSSLAVHVVLIVAVTLAGMSSSQAPTWNKLFVALGDPIDYGLNYNSFIMSDVEIVDLAQDPPLPCFKPADYPLKTYDAFGAFVGGAPTICGGKNDPEFDVFDQCYRYDVGRDEWELVGRLSIGRANGGHVVTSNGTAWLVVDGETGGFPTVEAETSADGAETWQLAPEYDIYPVYAGTSPPQIFDNDILEINETHLLSIGGSPYSERNIYFWDGVDLFWDYVVALDLEFRQYYPNGLTGMATLSDGTRIVVHGVDGSTRRTEFLDLELMEIRDGVDWPFDHFDSEEVQRGSSFLSVGGSLGAEAASEIVRFVVPDGPDADPLDSSFQLMPQTLQSGRRGHVAILVPDDFVECG